MTQIRNKINKTHICSELESLNHNDRGKKQKTHPLWRLHSLWMIVVCSVNGKQFCRVNRIIQRMRRNLMTRASWQNKQELTVYVFTSTVKEAMSCWVLGNSLRKATTFSRVCFRSRNRIAKEDKIYREKQEEILSKTNMQSLKTLWQVNSSRGKLTGVFEPLQVSTVFMILSQTAPKTMREGQKKSMPTAETQTGRWVNDLIKIEQTKSLNTIHLISSCFD